MPGPLKTLRWFFTWCGGRPSVPGGAQGRSRPRLCVDALEERALLTLSASGTLQPDLNGGQGAGDLLLGAVSVSSPQTNGSTAPTARVPVTWSLPAFQFQAALSASPPPGNGTAATSAPMPLTGSVTITNVLAAGNDIARLGLTIVFPDGAALNLSAAAAVFLPPGGAHLVAGPIDLHFAGAGIHLGGVDVLIRAVGDSATFLIRQWVIPLEVRLRQVLDQAFDSVLSFQFANLRLEPIDLRSKGLEVSTSSPITLDAFADMRPGTPLGNLLPHLADMGPGASLGTALPQVADLSGTLRGVAAAMNLFLDRALTFPWGSLASPDERPPFDALLIRMLIHPPPSPSGSGGVYPYIQVSIMPPSSGGGRLPPLSSSDEGGSPYKRREVIDEPYSQEPGVMIDPDLDEPEERTKPLSPLEGRADEVDELGLGRLPPLNLTPFGGALARLPSNPNDMPTRLPALSVGPAGDHHDRPPISVRDDLVCASVWVGLALPASRLREAERRRAGHAARDEVGRPCSMRK